MRFWSHIRPHMVCAQGVGSDPLQTVQVIWFGGLACGMGLAGPWGKGEGICIRAIIPDTFDSKRARGGLNAHTGA